MGDILEDVGEHSVKDLCQEFGESCAYFSKIDVTKQSSVEGE